MPKRLTDGNTQATWVTAIADINAPAAGTELNAATSVPLGDAITDDGLNITFDEGAVAGNALTSTQDFEGPGRAKANIELTMYRFDDVNEDKPWSTLVRGSQAFLVVRRGVVASSPYAVGDEVEVYEVTVGQRRKLAPERESYEKWLVKLYSSGPFSVDSTVAT